MRRATAIRLLFWFHDRERWNGFYLRHGYYVWPPFPRADEFLSLRVKLHDQSARTGAAPA
jgi:hypothetical protein